MRGACLPHSTVDGYRDLPESFLFGRRQALLPRGRQGQRHPLTAMLAGVVCATLWGARGFKPIAQWLPATWHWLGFRRRPPCANCFADLFKAISPEEFERAVREWTDQLEGVHVDGESLSAVSIDGKTLCGTLQARQRAIHLLSAFDHQSGCVLSQTQVNAGTNEPPCWNPENSKYAPRYSLRTSHPELTIRTPKLIRQCD